MRHDQQNLIQNSGDTCTDDEIDLMDLVDIIVRRKWLIVVVTALVTATAALYSVVTPKVYRASLSFRPASVLAVVPLNVNLPFAVASVENMSAEVFESFVGGLQDPVVRKGVWEELALKGGENNRSFAEFNQSFDFQSQKGRNKTSLELITYEGSDPVYAAEAITLLVKKANAKAVEQTVGEIVGSLIYQKISIFVEMERRKLDIRAEIASMRKIAAKQRLALVARLEQDLRIATAAGVVSPSIRQQDAGGQSAASVIYTDGLPHYMLGEQVLRAELAQVLQRKDNDSDINGLPELQAELDLLENVHGSEAGDEANQLDNPFFLKVRMIDEEIARLNSLQENSDIHLAVATDLPASVPESPVKPQGKKIIALFFVVGLMLSFFAVFGMNFLEAYRQRKLMFKSVG